MKAKLNELSSILIGCVLFFLFFPVSKWLLLLVFAAIDYALYRIDEKRNINVYVLLALLFSLSFCLFYPNFTAILCLCLCLFLFHTLKVEPGKKLMMSLFLFGIHLFNSPSFLLMIILSGLLLFHLILTILITSRNKFQLSQRMKLLVTIAIGSSIAIGIIPYIANGIKNVLSLWMYSLTTILSKGISGVVHFGELNKEKEERINKLVATNPNDEKVQYTEYETNPYLADVLMMILFILLTVMMIYIVKRRRVRVADFKHKVVNMEGNTSIALKREQKNGKAFMRTHPPTIPVRKLVYYFERDMKGAYSRKTGESFYHWLTRINIDTKELNKRLSEIYEKSRYGEEEIPKNEVMLFKEGLKQIKKQLN